MQHTRFNVYPAKAFHAQGNMRVAVAWLPISYDMHTYFNEYVHIYIYASSIFSFQVQLCSEMVHLRQSRLVAWDCLGPGPIGNIATKPSLMNGLPSGNLA